MAEQKKIKSRSFFRKFLKVLLFSFIAWIMFLIIATAVFYIFKDDISKKLLLSLNEVQNGEITLEDISFEPFAQFPSVSIGINNIVYYEHPIIKRDSIELPIGEINEIYAAINILDLIGGKVNVSKVTIISGAVRIVTYADSSVNLSNAFGKQKQENSLVGEDISLVESDKQTNIKSTIQDSTLNENKSEIDLSIDGLSIENLTLIFENHVLDRSSKFRINNLNTSFSYREKRILSELKTDTDIIEIKFPGKTLLSDKKVNLITSLAFDEENETILIDPSRFSFEESIFDIEGKIDVGEEGLLDLKIDGSDHDFSFLSLVLSDKGITQLGKGDFYMKGSITGNTFLEIPVIELYFGLSDVDIFIPEVEKRIKG
ncbi:MAG: hypothetical protein WBG58_16215, partial [Ignavibacteriaceae bacterium]